MKEFYYRRKMKRASALINIWPSFSEKHLKSFFTKMLRKKEHHSKWKESHRKRKKLLKGDTIKTVSE